MTLKFVDEHDNRIYIATVADVNEAIAEIIHWCDRVKFKSRYVRYTEHEHYYWLDFGSHVCFFVLEKA